LFKNPEAKTDDSEHIRLYGRIVLKYTLNKKDDGVVSVISLRI